MFYLRANIFCGFAAVFSATVCVAAPIVSSATPAANAVQTSVPTHWIAKAGAPANVQKFVPFIPQAKAEYISSATKNISALKQQKDAIDTAQNSTAYQQDLQLAAEERRMRSRLLAAQIRAETDAIYRVSQDPMWLPSDDMVLHMHTGSVGHIRGRFRVLRILDAHDFIAMFLDANGGSGIADVVWVNGIDTNALAENSMLDPNLIAGGMYRVGGTRVYGSPADPARMVNEIEPIDIRSNLVAVSDYSGGASYLSVPAPVSPAIPFAHTTLGIAEANKLNQAHAVVANAQNAAALAFDRTPQGIDLNKAVTDADAQRQAASGQEKLDASHAFVVAKAKLDEAEQAAVRDDAGVNVAIATVIATSSEQAADAAAYLQNPAQ